MGREGDVNELVKGGRGEDGKEALQKSTDSVVEMFGKELGNEKHDVKIEK